MLSQHQSAAPQRLEALKERHAILSRTIDKAERMPARQDLDIRRLKLEKLKIKEEIELSHRAQTGQ